MPQVEWLEADGLGGFASGTNTGIRTRRYHGLLLAATSPPTGRVMLVNGFEAWIETATGRIAISSHHYAPDVVHPDGIRRLTSFVNDPWPRWIYRLDDDGTEIEQEVIVPQGSPAAAVRWRLHGSHEHVVLHVRLLLSGRDYHATHHENGAFRFDAEVDGHRITWRPYDGIPAITAVTNGVYAHKPDWFRSFLYDAERTRGLDYLEDLASPGEFTFDLARPAILHVTARAYWSQASIAGNADGEPENAETAFRRIHDRERARRIFPSPLHRAADAYLVQRGTGKTILAGYPWFTDWGRDTFIAMRGLCIATGRLTDARDILLAWATTVSEGMLPNRFPDRGDSAEFNAVDASLWYVVAVHDFLGAASHRRFDVTPAQAETLGNAVGAIVEGYSAGTRFNIHADADGLLACGAPGVQLTWMDSKIGDWVVTPRIGKPVEIQALWLNALAIAARWSERWTTTFEKGRTSFQDRFWNEAHGILYDVVDVDHESGRVDAAFRPNQILAIGGLPLVLVDDRRARRIVDAVASKLVTPMGLRSLAPGSPEYAPRYEGNAAERDARYHQGSVWPWLIGPFVEAWLRVQTPSAHTIAEARERFLGPLLNLAQPSGGHLPEVADAEPPHTPRGCPQQAWSVGELLRLEHGVLRAGSYA